MPLNKHKILVFHCINWYRTTSSTIGKRRRRETSDCKPTPLTPVCSNVLADLENPSRYFRTTFQYGNYFGHDSTDEAVYELSKFVNLLSSLLTPDDPGDRQTYTFCYQALTILLCHLHLPVCPRSPLPEHSCLDSVDNTSACFDAIKDLNSKGANFAWPPVKVNCENKTELLTVLKEAASLRAGRSPSVTSCGTASRRSASKCSQVSGSTSFQGIYVMTKPNFMK